MEKELLTEGGITLKGQSFLFEIFKYNKGNGENKGNGLWRMLCVHDSKGNEVITIYDAIRQNLHQVLMNCLDENRLLATK